MIYRIAVYRDGKFDHYATPEELCLLRVNADGRVEALMVNGSLVTHPPRFHLLDVELDDDGDTPMGVYGKWYDVSDTHKVEWGWDFNPGRLYDNDILQSGGIVTVVSEFFRWVIWCSNDGRSLFDQTRVIGNINENSERVWG